MIGYRGIYSNQAMISKLNITHGCLAASFAFAGINLSPLHATQAPSTSISATTNRLTVLQTDNQSFSTRAEAFNSIRGRGKIPTTQQPITQWQNGNDTSRAGQSNYVLEKVRQSSWGNYYLYKVNSQYLVVAEHINDPDAPCPIGFTKPCKHFHVGTASTTNNTSFNQALSPDAAAATHFKSTDYIQVGIAHHYFYKG